MKRFSATALLLVLLSTAACKKDSTDPQPNGSTNTTTGTTAEVKATSAGGTAYAVSGTDNVDATYTTMSDPDEAPAWLAIRARGTDSRDITLSIYKFTGAGTYEILPGGPNIASYSVGELSDPAYASYNSQHMEGTASVGQVVITAWDAAGKQVQGTFTFTGRHRIGSGNFSAPQTVTGGSFDVRNVFVY